jgi:streptogramin lyase
MPGPDGRAWAAAGRDLYVADDLAGPWQHRQMPLPDGQCITRLDPVADGVLWFTTRPFPAVGRVSGGQLYRSPDDGAHWVRVAVGADCSS